MSGWYMQITQEDQPAIDRDNIPARVGTTPYFRIPATIGYLAVAMYSDGKGTVEVEQDDLSLVGYAHI